jgi:hypothetical protein
MERLLELASCQFANQEMFGFRMTLTMILEVELLYSHGPEAANHIANERKGIPILDKIAGKYAPKQRRAPKKPYPPTSKKRRYDDSRDNDEKRPRLPSNTAATSSSSAYSSYRQDRRY